MTPAVDTGAAAAIGDFPLLAAAAQAGEKLVYLDNAATTQKPACVLDAMDACYRTVNASPHRSGHRLATSATAAFEDARATVARFIGARADEVAFTSGATHALNIAAWACAAQLRPGDEIALTLLEHHSNLVPWQEVARRTGARIRYLVPDREGRLSDDEVDRIVGPKTRVVAVTGMSNVLGVVPPMERIAAASHANGAAVVLDCAQSIAHLPLDVRAANVDFAAFSGHKMYGPNGIGVLFASREAAAGAEPFLRGGGMVDAVFEHGATFIDAPRIFEAGTQNVAGAVGLATAMQYMEGIGLDKIAVRERALTQRLASGLQAIPTARLYGPSTDGAARGGIVSFNVRGVSAGDVAKVLDRRGIAVRAGAHCAQPLLRHLGIEAACRASIGIYNTEQDVDALLEAVEAARDDAVALNTARML